MVGAQRRHSKLGIVCLLGILGIAAAVSGVIPAAAQSNIPVYVSYADSYHPAANNFPTPWAGSSKTTFEGCAPAAACAYDGGAIRVVNNSPSSVTVDSITVKLATCTFTGWPSAVLAPGADLIVTQLASGAAAGCTGPLPTTFDLSDIGPGGINYVGSCVRDGLVAEVDVTVDGTTTVYHDTGQVLNSGGYDPGNCGLGANESSQWTLIGTGPCPGSSFSLAPPSQTDQVNSTATVTATFTNSCGQPLSNADVNFAILSGPNAGTTGSGVTDVNGQVAFSYSSSKLGTDTVQATITNPGGTIPSNSVTVTWIVNFAPGGGGAFVISDLKDKMSQPVYWWGAQWWKNDPLSTGLAPASFKGYENGNASPWCGQSWTTRPGNSPHPPQSVPANTDMAVIVSSTVTKTGPTISGDIVAIVMVHTNAGYGPNPGHPGTGTVVAILCHQAAASTQSRTAAPGAPHAGHSAAPATPTVGPVPPANSAAACSTSSSSHGPQPQKQHGNSAASRKETSIAALC